MASTLSGVSQQVITSTIFSTVDCFFCHKKESNESTLKKCSRCSTALYCDPTCQKNDWNAHKKICPLLAGQKQREIEQKSLKAQERLDVISDKTRVTGLKQINSCETGANISSEIGLYLQLYEEGAISLKDLAPMMRDKSAQMHRDFKNMLRNGEKLLECTEKQAKVTRRAEKYRKKLDRLNSHTKSTERRSSLFENTVD